MFIMKTNSNGRNFTFSGMALRAPTRVIRNAQDAIEQWKVLKHPKFTNIFQESEEVSDRLILENQQIRNLNYSFLENLKSITEKAKDILKGDVECAFEFYDGGRESIHLFPQTSKTLKKYYNFNVYSRD